jgi:hypothetical protein
MKKTEMKINMFIGYITKHQKTEFDEDGYVVLTTSKEKGKKSDCLSSQWPVRRVKITVELLNK